jgi:hypothetical protein
LPDAAPIEQLYINLLTDPQVNHGVRVATTRVPDFTPGTIQKPANGYRYLGFLADVSFQFTYPSTTWDPSHDILAVHEIGQNADSHEFACIWKPSGLQLTSHFIIIFIHPSPTQQPSPLSYAGDIAGMRSTPVYMHTSSGAHTPASTTFIDDQDAGPSNLNIHSESSPLAPAVDGTVQASAPTISQLTSVREKLSIMDSSKTLTDICTMLEIDWNTAVNPAHYIEVECKTDRWQTSPIQIDPNMVIV